MTITEKTIISDLKFDEKEKEFLKKLATTCQTICQNHEDTCETCILEYACHDTCCEDTFNFLLKMTEEF